MTAGGIQQKKYEFIESLSSTITEKNPVTSGNTALTTQLEEKKSRNVLGKYYFTDSGVSDEEPIVFNTCINNTGGPEVVPENPCELGNKDLSHTQYIEPDPRNLQKPNKKERIMCHAETRSEEISTEECGLMKDLEPMSECARGVVEPVSLVRASTSFV